MGTTTIADDMTTLHNDAAFYGRTLEDSVAAIWADANLCPDLHPAKAHMVAHAHRMAAALDAILDYERQEQDEAYQDASSLVAGMTGAQADDAVEELIGMAKRIEEAQRDLDWATAEVAANRMDIDERESCRDLLHGYRAERDGAVKMLTRIYGTQQVAILTASADARRYA